MYDANPRRHLARAKDLLSRTESADYPRLRYSALDLRLAIETTFQEILSACYKEFLDRFGDLWRTKDFIREIRKQNRDFDLKNQLVPVVIRKKKKIADYLELDLDRLSSIHRQLSDHLHHLNRYDRKKGSADRAALLVALLQEATGYLEGLLKHPRYWVEFYDSDAWLFEEVLSGRRSLEYFIKYIETKHLKNYAVIDIHHLQEGTRPTSEAI